MEFFEVGEPLRRRLEAGFLSFKGFAEDLFGAGEGVRVALERPRGEGLRT